MTKHRSRDAKFFEELITQLYGDSAQTDAGDLIGVNRATIARWCKGEYEPTQAAWDALQNELHKRLQLLTRINARWEKKKPT